MRPVQLSSIPRWAVIHNCFVTHHDVDYTLQSRIISHHDAYHALTNDMLVTQHLWQFAFEHGNVRYAANQCWKENLLFYLLGFIPTCCPEEPLVSKFSFLSQQDCSTDLQTRLGESITSRGHKTWATLCVQAFRPNASFVVSVKPRAGRVMCTFVAECILDDRIRYGSETWLPFA